MREGECRKESEGRRESKEGRVREVDMYVYGLHRWPEIFMRGDSLA